MVASRLRQGIGLSVGCFTSQTRDRTVVCWLLHVSARERTVVCWLLHVSARERTVVCWLLHVSARERTVVCFTSQQGKGLLSVGCFTSKQGIGLLSVVASRLRQWDRTAVCWPRHTPYHQATETVWGKVQMKGEGGGGVKRH